MNLGEFLISLVIVVAITYMFEKYIDYKKKGK